MVTLYKRKNFKIYATMSSKNEYLIVNINKPFHEGHSHVNDYKLAKYIIDLAVNYKIPNKNKTFIIDSLIRLSSDKNYIKKLKYIRSLTNK